MTSVKVKFRPSVVAGDPGTLYIQLIHNRCTRQVSTPYQIYSDEWNDKTSTIVLTSSEDRRQSLAAIRESLRFDLARMRRVIRILSEIGMEYTADEVVYEYTRQTNENTVYIFMSDMIAKLRGSGRLRTAETYCSTMNCFMRFRGGADMPFDNLTSSVVEQFEAWLRVRGLCANTISFYMRILRAVYNRAVDSGIIEDRQPFRHVYTGIDKTIKRALPLKSIKKIMSLDLSSAPGLDYARDMFMMSFFLRGMSFIDMAFLRKSDVKHGSLTYRRRKTGQMLKIRWTQEMQSVVDKYPSTPTEYLLPILCRKEVNEWNAYRNASYNINRCLKQIAIKAELDMPLTLYVARHSWASIARSQGVPLSVISEGMGHDSEVTTQIYLASLDNNIVDRANALILSALR